jgi:drug/metabolite transporter (DMT)-like permease
MNSTVKIILPVILWGSIGVFVKQINLPSLEIAFLRAVIGASVVGLAGFRLRQKNIEYTKQNIAFLLMAGAAIGLNWIFLFQSYRFTTLANATLSYYFAPVFVVLLSPLVLKEKFTPAKLISVAGAIGGLFLILNSQGSDIGNHYDHFKGISYGLGAAVLYASVILFNKKMRSLPVYEMTLAELCVASLILFPFIIARNNLHLDNVQIGSLIPMLILGILHTGLAYLLYFSGLKQIKAQSAALLSYLDPISAVIFGALLLREPINCWQVVGGILILISTLYGELTGTKKVKENRLEQKL